MPDPPLGTSGQDPKKYEVPDGAAHLGDGTLPTGGFNLNQVQDPGDESRPIDYSAYIDRLARGIVLGVMSVINPAPGEGSPGGTGGSSGGGSGPVTAPGIVGGDPADETPLATVTTPKGPNPGGLIGPGGGGTLPPASGGGQSP